MGSDRGGMRGLEVGQRERLTTTQTDILTHITWRSSGGSSVADLDLCCLLLDNQGRILEVVDFNNPVSSTGRRRSPQGPQLRQKRRNSSRTLNNSSRTRTGDKSINGGLKAGLCHKRTRNCRTRNCRRNCHRPRRHHHHIPHFHRSRNSNLCHSHSPDKPQSNTYQFHRRRPS